MPCTANYATSSRTIKGEDVMFVRDLGAAYPLSTIYVVSDGHAGVAAANFVGAHFLPVLLLRLPATFPDLVNCADLGPFAESIRKALCDTFVLVHDEWADQGNNAGATLTVALVIGGVLLTVANVGDSDAVLDTGRSMLEVTCSHRVQSCVKEQERLKAAGCNMAQLGFHLQGPAKPGDTGVGPLRIWPGGLCVSRSIGDADAGHAVVPIPHIKQVLIPEQGCRVIMASDGLWDVMTLSKAVKMTRSKATESAASALLSAVAGQSRFNDDTSIIVIDLLPEGVTTFPAAVLAEDAVARAVSKTDIRVVMKVSSSPGGLFSCFKAEVSEVDSRDTAGPGHLQLYADVDCLKAYPDIFQQLLNRPSESLQQQPASGQDADSGQREFTMHNETYFSGRDQADMNRNSGKSAMYEDGSSHYPRRSPMIPEGAPSMSENPKAFAVVGIA